MKEEQHIRKKFAVQLEAKKEAEKEQLAVLNVTGQQQQRAESALLLLLARILLIVGATIQSLRNKDTVFKASLVTCTDYPWPAHGRFPRPPASVYDYPGPRTSVTTTQGPQ